MPEYDLYIFLIAVTISTSAPLGSNASALFLGIIFYATSLSSVSALFDRPYSSTYIWNLQTDTPSHFWHVLQRRREVIYSGKEVNMGGTRIAGTGNGINSLKILVDDRERKRALGRYLSGWKNNYRFNLQ